MEKQEQLQNKQKQQQTLKMTKKTMNLRITFQIRRIALLFTTLLIFSSSVQAENESDSENFKLVNKLDIPNIGTIRSMVVDSFAGFAYLGTDDSPGKVIQVNLSSMAVVQTLELNSGENELTCAVIDTNEGYAYFGTDTVHGKIVKVDIRTMRRVETIHLSGAHQDYLTSAVIDTSLGFAFFGTNAPATARVIRVRLSDFTYQGSITLNAFEDYLTSAVADPSSGYAYFGTNYKIWPGKRVVKIDMRTFQRVEDIQLSQDSLWAATIDTPQGYAYFGTGGGEIVKISLKDFQYEKAIEGLEKIQSATSLPLQSEAFFGADDGILRVNLTSFSVSGKVPMQGPKNAAVVDRSSSMALFGSGSSVLQVQLGALCPGNCSRRGECSQGVCQCPTGWTGDSCETLQCPNSCSDHGTCVNDTCRCESGWKGIDCRQAVCKDDCNGHGVCERGVCQCHQGWSGTTCDWGLTSSLKIPNVGPFYCAVADTTSGFAYLGSYDSPAVIVKINLRNFSEVSRLQLEVGENKLRSAVIDTQRGYAYFGTDTFHGVIVRINLAKFIREDAIYLDGFAQDYLTSAVIDTQRGYAYFGTSALATARVVRVGLDKFTYEGSLALDATEGYLTSSVIDTQRGFAYFGTSYQALPGNAVVKIDVKNFTRVGRVTFPMNQFAFQAAAIDPVRDVAYFGTNQGTGKISKISLEELRILGTYQGDFSYFQSAAINPSDNFAYFGGEGQLLRMDLISFTANESLSFPTNEAFTASVIDLPSSTALFVAGNEIFRVQLYDTCPSDCNRHGACQRGVCVCESNWEGDVCQTYVPPPSPDVSFQSEELIFFFRVSFGVYLLSLVICVAFSLRSWKLRNNFQSKEVTAVMFLFLALAIGLRCSQFGVASFTSAHTLHFLLLSILTTLTYFAFFLILVHTIFSWLHLPVALGGRSVPEKFLGTKMGLVLGMALLILASQVTLISVTSRSVQEVLLTCQIVIFSIFHTVFFSLWVYFSKKFQSSIREISVSAKNARSELQTQTYLLTGIVTLQMLLWSATERSTLIEGTTNQELIYWVVYVIADVFSFGMVIVTALRFERFYFGKSPNERSSLIQNIDSDEIITPEDLVSGSAKEKPKRRGLKKKICLVVTILILLSLGLAVFFLFPRYPSWEIQSMEYESFHINSDFTVAVSFNVQVEIVNRAYAKAHLVNATLSLFWRGFPLGTAELGDFDLQARKSIETNVHIDLPRITASIGISILQEMIANNGILSVDVEGDAQVKAMGMNVKIGVECVQVVDTFQLPTKIIGGNCTYSYG